MVGVLYCRRVVKILPIDRHSKAWQKECYILKVRKPMQGLGNRSLERLSVVYMVKKR